MNRCSALRCCLVMGVAVVLLAAGRWALSAEESASGQIDWQHAKQLHQKAQQGQSLSDEEKEAYAAKFRGRVSANKGKKFGPQSPERRAAQSEKLKAYIASLTPEQREARMAAARKAQPEAWRAQMASKTKEERKAMMAAADAANPMKQKALQGG